MLSAVSKMAGIKIRRKIPVLRRVTSAREIQIAETERVARIQRRTSRILFPTAWDFSREVFSFMAKSP